MVGSSNQSRDLSKAMKLVKASDVVLIILIYSL